MNQNTRLWLGTVVFAIIWIVGMIWWSGNYNLGNIAGLSVAGIIVAVAWRWAMNRFLFRR